MTQRGYETGMDFSYDNGRGAIDAGSPFAQVGQNNGGLRSFATGTPANRKREDFFAPAKSRLGIDGDTYTGAFESSQRPQTPSRLQSSTAKPLPPNPPAAFNGYFNTPRTMTNDLDDSSAGETPKSPEQTTPDTMGRSQLSNAITRFESTNLNAQAGAERSSPTKEKERPMHASVRRESFFGRIKNKLYSPGRGEIPRVEHSGAVEKRVKKRRERDIQKSVARRRRHSMSDSGEDSERPRRSPRKASGQRDEDAEGKPHWVSSLFTFIAKHPTVPHILSFYAQLAFNVFMLAGCAYLMYCAWAAVQGDVDKKSHEAMADIMAEMAVCAKEYTTNRCGDANRPPALENVCNNWSKCMNRDPSKVGRARVSAHTFAEIFNSFVEPISWKAMIFTAFLVIGCFGISNLAFGLLREKTNQYHQPNYYPPPTPQRGFSQEYQQPFGTPWSQMPQGLEPQPSAGYGQIEGRGSPVRKLVYN